MRQHGSIPAAVWRDLAMADALGKRDVGAVLRIGQSYGVALRTIAALTGRTESEIRDIINGDRVVDADLARMCACLGAPSAAMEVHPARSVVRLAVRLVSPRTVPGRWSGEEARVLRQARRMSVRGFAAHLGVSDRMVSKWEAGGSRIFPRPVNQTALDTSLAKADQATRARFSAALVSTQPVVSAGSVLVELELSHEQAEKVLAALARSRKGGV